MPEQTSSNRPESFASRSPMVPRVAGAKLSVGLDLHTKQVLADPRLKAVVGYVPYFGQPIFPAFGPTSPPMSTNVLNNSGCITVRVKIGRAHV